MKRYRVTPQARSDLRDIYQYVAERNPTAAGTLRRLFYEKFRTIAAIRYMGDARDDLAPGVRVSAAGSYVIVFRPIDDRVDIIQVVHGARDLETVFCDVPPE